MEIVNYRHQQHLGLKQKNDKSKAVDTTDLTEEITEWDQQAYLNTISTELTEEQKLRIINPEKISHRQESVLAVHWHPEFVPMDLIEKRIDVSFPGKKNELIIPTQHNVLISYGRYTGVEVDCYSSEFKRKIQLLLHFEESRLSKADKLKEMLAHTHKYRSSQLFEILHTITDKKMEHRLQLAVDSTGADEETVRFIQINAYKLEKLIIKNEAITPEDSIKNALLANYIDMYREHYDRRFINCARNFVKAVKKIVKANFTLEYFYQTGEIIEEARYIGGGIVVPHPEQFWPVLLAEYDVDGYEVWNPQSKEYTEFLINVVKNGNKNRKQGDRRLLIFMGDDTHMGEKVKEPKHQNPTKANREIGVQDAWDDPVISKNLIIANAGRLKVIEEYKNRIE